MVDLILTSGHAHLTRGGYCLEGAYFAQYSVHAVEGVPAARWKLIFFRLFHYSLLHSPFNFEKIGVRLIIVIPDESLGYRNIVLELLHTWQQRDSCQDYTDTDSGPGTSTPIHPASISTRNFKTLVLSYELHIINV